MKHDACRRAYAVTGAEWSIKPRVRRVLVRDSGLVFYPGQCWKEGPDWFDRLVVLPVGDGNYWEWVYAMEAT